MTMRSHDAPEVASILEGLLQAAEMPGGEGSPVVLVSHEFNAWQIADICIAMSDHNYHNQSGDTNTVRADEHIKFKLDAGFKLVNMSIVRSWGPGGTHHVLMTVLVKFKDN